MTGRVAILSPPAAALMCLVGSAAHEVVPRPLGPMLATLAVLVGPALAVRVTQPGRRGPSLPVALGTGACLAAASTIAAGVVADAAGVRVSSPVFIAAVQIELVIGLAVAAICAAYVRYPVEVDDDELRPRPAAYPVRSPADHGEAKNARSGLALVLALGVLMFAVVNAVGRQRPLAGIPSSSLMLSGEYAAAEGPVMVRPGAPILVPVRLVGGRDLSALSGEVRLGGSGPSPLRISLQRAAGGLAGTAVVTAPRRTGLVRLVISVPNPTLVQDPAGNGDPARGTGRRGELVGQARQLEVSVWFDVMTPRLLYDAQVPG